MAITEEDIRTEKDTDGKDNEYLLIKYSNGTLHTVKDLTEKLKYDGNYEKTLQLALGALDLLVKRGTISLKVDK